MNNPPAFPQPNYPITWANGEGMTLRDYFAAKAMQGLMHNYDICDFLEHKDWLEDISITSYQIADAMMKAREA